MNMCRQGDHRRAINQYRAITRSIASSCSQWEARKAGQGHVFCSTFEDITTSGAFAAGESRLLISQFPETNPSSIYSVLTDEAVPKDTPKLPSFSRDCVVLLNRNMLFIMKITSEFDSSTKRCTPSQAI